MVLRDELESTVSDFLLYETSLATLNTILTPVEQNFGEMLTNDHVTLHHSCTAEGCK